MRGEVIGEAVCGKRYIRKDAKNVLRLTRYNSKGEKHDK